MATSLATAQYLSLATYRRNGEAVETPVWFAADGGAIFVFSAGDAGKVKRLRNSARARVAPCDVRGRILGDWIDAEAELLDDPADRDRAWRALRAKYGWRMRGVDVFSRLAGRIERRAYIRIRLASPGTPPAARAARGRGKPGAKRRPAPKAPGSRNASRKPKSPKRRPKRTGGR